MTFAEKREPDGAPWSFEPLTAQAVGNIRSPELRELYRHWASLKRVRDVPLKAAFHPALVKTALPHLLLADLIDGGRGYRVRLIGSAIRRFLPFDTTGQTFYDDDPQLGRRRMCGVLKLVVAERVPYRVEVSASALPGKDIYSMESIGLPMSRDGSELDLALVGLVFTPRLPSAL